MRNLKHSAWTMIFILMLVLAACQPVQPLPAEQSIELPTAAVTQAAGGPVELSGRYEGSLAIAGLELEIAVEWQTGAEGYAGTIDIPQQGATGIPLHDIQLDAPSVHFEMLDGPQLAIFDGEFAPDGSIAGTMTQSGYEGVFSLVPAAGDAVDSPATPTEAALYEDPLGRFTAPIPTNWTATEGDGFALLSDPEDQIKMYLLALEGDEIEKAIADGWQLVAPGFDLPVDETVEPPSDEGVEKTIAIGYDTDDDERFVQGVGQLKDGVVYIILFDSTLEGLQKRNAQVTIVGSGFKITTLEKSDLSGTAPLPITTAATQELEQFIDIYMDAFGVPGAAVGIVQDGELVYAKGFGVADPETGAAVAPDTNMMIGSTGKSLTTMLMATLVDDGLMTWDTPAQQLYPDFRVLDPELSEAITMRNLVCACTGVPRRDMELIFNASEQSAEDTVAALADFEFFTDFGEAFQYSNQMVATAGYIAGAVAEDNAADLMTDYTTALQERVLDPIGMEHTTTSFDAVRTWDNYAIPHTLGLDNTYRPVPIEFEEVLTPVAPAGVHWSTLEDMANYMITELNRGVAPDGERVVSAENLEVTWEPQIQVSADASYGLGWIVTEYHGQPVITHGGNTFGFTSGFNFMPDVSLGAIVLTNARASNPFNDGVASRLFEIVFEQEPRVAESLDFYLEQFEKQTTELAEKIEDKVDAEAVASHLGKYANPTLGEITLTMEDGKLIFDAGEFSSELLPKLDDDGELEGYIQLDPPLQGAVYKFEEDDAENPIVVLGAGAIKYTFEPIE